MRRAANSSAERSAGASRSVAAFSSAFGTWNDSPSPGAQPSNRLPSSRSASSPSAMTRAHMAATVARSSANFDRSMRRRESGESSHEAASNRLTVTAGRLPELRHHRLHSGAPRLEARLVGDQPRGGAAQDGGDAKAVLAQRPAGRSQVDDSVDEPNLRREFHRTMQSHDLHRLSMGLEPRGGGAWIF